MTSESSSQPSPTAPLLPHAPSTISTSDASGAGVGGVHFIPLPDGTIQPLLWHHPLLSSISDCLLINSNLSGTITMNDFGLAASVAHHDVFVQHADIRSLATHNLHDNTTSVYWQRKSFNMATKSATYLLHLQALHQRFRRYTTHHDYLWGPLNVMANDCSRLWHLSDSQVLSYFDS
jgi:hypothetical protein